MADPISATLTGSEAEVEIGEALSCEICETVKRVLLFDNSAGEYEPGAICLPCIQSLFEEAARAEGKKSADR